MNASRPIEQAIQQARAQMWDLLERENAVPEPDVWGRTPNFDGTEAAADLLADVQRWRAARVAGANPNRAQLPVRQRALAAGKTVFLAVPDLTHHDR